MPTGQLAPKPEALQTENRRLQRELRRAQEQRDIPQKPWAHNLGAERERFVRIEVAQWLSRLGGVGTGTTRPVRCRSLAAHRAILGRKPPDLRYGSPHIRQRLGRHGQNCSRHRVARLMRGHRMASQTKRRFRVALTDSNHDLPIAPSRLCESTPSAQRDAVWVPNITCVDTEEGWLYVAGGLVRHTQRCMELDDGGHAGHEPAPVRAGHGVLVSAAQARTGASIGSGCAIRQRRPPATLGRRWRPAEHEPAGQLLR